VRDWQLMTSQFTIGKSTVAKPIQEGEHHATVECLIKCLVPDFDGALSMRQWKDALWDRYFTAAPARQRRCVERYKIVLSGRRPRIKGLFSAMEQSWMRS